MTTYAQDYIEQHLAEYKEWLLEGFNRQIDDHQILAFKEGFSIGFQLAKEQNRG